MFSKVLKSSFNQLYKNTSFVHQSLTYAPLRGISLHEYQAAQVLNKYNLPVLLVLILALFHTHLSLRVNLLTLLRKLMMLVVKSEMKLLRLEELKALMKSITLSRLKYNHLNLIFSHRKKVLAGGRGRGYFKENNFEGGVHIQYTPENVPFTQSFQLFLTRHL